MKFSELWLREWVNPAISREMLSEQITMAGLEVEAVEVVSKAFHQVVVGEVVTCVAHPNADKLQVTQVDIGGTALLNIVCGAPNCRQGLKVAVATVGALLPGDFKIKSATLRGILSQGMLCSFAELGINDEHEGIIELPLQAPVGMDLRRYLHLDDHSIEVSVTPNRADCLSLLGIARDVAVLNKLPLNFPSILPVAEQITTVVPIRIEAPEACPRYLGRVIKGVNMNAKTPLWLREKLRRCGIRAIDPVVDVTNYVMLELGQPMHAFHLPSIQGGIVVRLAKQGEKLTLLDGSEVALQHETLVIADQQKPLALAGIFGGKDSGVTPTTEDVLLECAYFNPQALVGRARQYGLHTESSHRYERGVDPGLQVKAMERATGLLMDICGGAPGSVIVVEHDRALPKRSRIRVRRDKLDSLIGYHIDDTDVVDILQRLGCQLSVIDAGWNILPPSWRFDLAIEEDVVEEVVRIYGYNRIPDVPVQAALMMSHHHEADLSLERVKTLLVDRGYQEAITYSFVDPKIQTLLHPHRPALLLPNPISPEMSAMRLSLWTGLLSALVYNQNRQQSRIRLFETGLRFIPDNKADLGIRQDMMLAGVIAGGRDEEHWDGQRHAADFYDLKGDIEAILELTGQQKAFQFQVDHHPGLHPGQSAGIYFQGKCVGFIGLVHPDLERKLDLNGRTILFEMEWQALAQRTIPLAQDISRYPANRRDIAVVVAEEVLAEDILAECRKVGANQIVGVNLFDVYRGKGVEEGHKSLAISLVLQDTTRTLEEDEIATTVAKCVEVLKQRFQASLRN